MRGPVLGVIGSLIGMICIVAGASAQQSFSCSFGSEPACLDYGAVVCKSGAKCVTRDAICFDSFTCDYDGFVCKSDADDAVKKAVGEVADEYESVRRKYNNLVNCLNGASDMDDVRLCGT
jgi:hypothetical protein